MHEVRIELAGRPSVRVVDAQLDGAVGVDLSQVKRQVLLVFAFLIWERRRLVERERLAELLWPGGLPASWESALRNVLSEVRDLLAAAGLPRDALATAVGCCELRLSRAVTVDVERAAADVRTGEAALAEQQPAAAEQHAGAAADVLAQPFLAGLRGRWVEDRQAELRVLRGRALRTLAAARLARADPDGAVSAADELIALDPLAEDGHLLLIDAHVAAGRRAAAAAAYRRCRSIWLAELGVEPPPLVQRRYADLSVRPPTPPTAEPRPRSGLVGRADELGALHAGWAQAVAGAGGLALVTGEAGAGKTSLCLELGRAVAGDGGRVLYGRCDEDRVMPLQPFAEALDAWAATLPPDGPPGLLPAHRAVLARLVARLAGAAPTRTPAAGRAPERRWLLAAVLAAVHAAAADGPLLLILDDLHWADGDTIAVARHLARSAATVPGLFIVVTHRPVPRDDPGPLAGWLADLRRDGTADRPQVAVRASLLLGGLDVEDVIALAEQLTGAPLDADARDAAAAITKATGGNPFFTREVLRERIADHSLGSTWPDVYRVPDAVEDLLLRKVRGLPVDARRLIEAASAVGVEFPLTLARTAAQLPEPAALDALDAAVTAGLLSEADAGSARFAHEITRAAVYGRLGSARRAALHARLAAQLQEQLRSGSSRPRALAELARHTGLAAPGSPDAVQSAERAAQAAAHAGAFADAARLYRVALDHLAALGQRDDLDQRDAAAAPHRGDLLVELALAARGAGDTEAAGAVLEEAVQLARRLGSADLLGRAAVALANPVRTNPRADPRPLALVDEALAALGPEPTPLRAALLARRAQYVVHLGDDRATEGVALEAQRTAERTGTAEARAAALGARLHALERPDRAQERLLVARELDRLVAPDGDPELALLAVEKQVSAHMTLGDGAAMRAATAEYAALAAASHLPQGEWFAVQHRICAAVLDGRFADLEPLLDQFRTRGLRAVDEPAILEHGIRLYLVVPRWMQRRVTELRAGFEDTTRFLPQQASIPAGRAFHDAFAGRTRDAGRRLRELAAAGYPASVPAGPLWSSAQFYLATACVQAGTADVAEALIDVLAPHRELVGTYLGFICHGAYAYHLGRLEALRGNRSAALAYLHTAAALHERLGAASWQDLTHRALADLAG